MKIFVAGATGVIGRSLVPMLLAAGHDVIGMTRYPARAERLRAQGAWATVVDAFDRPAVVAVVGREKPDAVIHQLTSLSHWDYAENARLRVEGTRNLVDAALAAGVRLMVAQSYPIYAPGPEPAQEHDPLDFESPAGQRTAQGVQSLEDAVAEMPRGVVLRYASLYGPGTLYSKDSPFAERVRRGEVTATGDIRSFLHVEDAARAALLALDWPAGTVNIADDEPAAGTAWLPVYAAAIDAPPPPVDPAVYGGARGVSNAKARRELGWAPFYLSWREGFKIALG